MEPEDCIKPYDEIRARCCAKFFEGVPRGEAESLREAFFDWFDRELEERIIRYASLGSDAHAAFLEIIVNTYEGKGLEMKKRLILLDPGMETLYKISSRLFKMSKKKACGQMKSFSRKQSKQYKKALSQAHDRVLECNREEADWEYSESLRDLRYLTSKLAGSSLSRCCQRIKRRLRAKACPSCGSKNIARLVYSFGYMKPFGVRRSIQRKVATKDIVIEYGGCTPPRNPKRYICNECGEKFGSHARWW